MLNDETERALRSAYARTVGELEVADSMPGRVTRAEHRRRRRQRTIAAAALGPLAMVGAAVPLSLHAMGHHDNRTTIRLASYDLSLPGKYTPVKAGTTACNPWTGFFYPAPGSSTQAQPSRPSSSDLAAAAAQHGGCVAMALSAPYTPGSSDDPVPQVSDTQAVQVDGHQGWVGTSTWTGRQQQELGLIVPLANGQVRQLLVAATRVSRSQLVAAVSSGLVITDVPLCTPDFSQAVCSPGPNVPPAGTATTTSPSSFSTTTVSPSTAN